MLSWKGGQNSSTVCSIAHQLSMTTLSTNYHRWSAMSCLMNSKLSLTQRKQLNIFHRARPLVQTQYLQSGRSINGRETYRGITLHVAEGGYPTRIEGCIYNPPIQAERKCSSVTTTGASLYCRFLGRYWKNPTESPERAS